MDEEKNLKSNIKETIKEINNTMKENEKYLFWESIKDKVKILGLGALIYISSPILSTLSYANFSLKIAQDPQVSKIYNSNISKEERTEKLDRIMEEKGYYEELANKINRNNILDKSSKAAGGASLAYFLIGGALDIRKYINKKK